MAFEFEFPDEKCLIASVRKVCEKNQSAIRWRCMKRFPHGFRLWFGVLVGVLFALSGLVNNARATVGGPETLELLGYQPKTGMIFLLNYSGGESGCLPDLWRYELRTRTLIKTHTCESTLMSEGTSIYDQALDEIKKQLIPIPSIVSELPGFSVSVDPLPARERVDIQTGEKTTARPARFLVRHQSESQTITIESCNKTDDPPQIMGAYAVTSTQNAFVILRYQGLCYEGGYTKDIVVFFSGIAQERNEQLSFQTIQLLSSSSLPRILKLQQALRALGYTSSIEMMTPTPKKIFFRLHTGSYLFKADAQAAARLLGKRFHLQPLIHTIKTTEQATIIQPPSSSDTFDTSGGFMDNFLGENCPGKLWKVTEQPPDGWACVNGMLFINNNQRSGHSALIETASLFTPPYVLEARFQHIPSGMPAGGVRFRFGAPQKEDFYEAVARTGESAQSIGGERTGSFLIHASNKETVWKKELPAIMSGRWYHVWIAVDQKKIVYDLYEDREGEKGNRIFHLEIGGADAADIPSAPVGIRVGDANGGVLLDWVRIVSTPAVERSTAVSEFGATTTTTIEFSQSTKYNLELKYPHFILRDTRKTANINQAVQTLIDREVQRFQKTVSRNDQSQDVGILINDYKIASLNDHIASISFSFLASIQGRPTKRFYKVINYDLDGE